MAVIRAWKANAKAWINVIQQNKVVSRQVTNQAMINALLDLLPTANPEPSVLDLGCGEGWLCRELAARNIRMTGVDVVPALIEQARRTAAELFPPVNYSVLSYQDVAEGTLARRYDGVVCNFSLLDEHSVRLLFSRVHTLLNPGGVLVLQTLHPDRLPMTRSTADTDTGWQLEHWQGFDESFPAPSPWFYRSLQEWQSLFHQSRLIPLEVIEPRHPDSGELMSLIMAGQLPD